MITSNREHNPLIPSFKQEPLVPVSDYHTHENKWKLITSNREHDPLIPSFKHEPLVPVSE
jgi:hypothetical protein